MNKYLILLSLLFTGCATTKNSYVKGCAHGISLFTHYFNHVAYKPDGWKFWEKDCETMYEVSTHEGADTTLNKVLGESN